MHADSLLQKNMLHSFSEFKLNMYGLKFKFGYVVLGMMGKGMQRYEGV